MLKEFKKELSKLSGVDFFNPKYRDVFKRYFDTDEADKAEADEKEKDIKVEDAKAVDAKTDAAVETKAEEVVADIKADKVADEKGKEPDYDKTDADETELKESIKEDQKADAEVVEADKESEDNSQAARQAALDKIIGKKEEPKVESAKAEEKPAEAVVDEPKAEPVVDEPANEGNEELLETRLELELVRAGVRNDRMDVAKDLFLRKLKEGKTMDEVKEMILTFPEWLATKNNAQPFGMAVNGENALTEREKMFKKLTGIDPRK